MICEHEGKILLCKRGIEPCKGLWTIPAGKLSHRNHDHVAIRYLASSNAMNLNWPYAGYMEMGESSAEGAARETMEEAKAAVEVIIC